MDMKQKPSLDTFLLIECTHSNKQTNAMVNMLITLHPTYDNAR